MISATTWRRVASVLLLLLLVAPAARSGHELPVYPSYYPHEIEIATLAPDRAGPLLRDGKIHAYVGAAPRFAGAPPDTIQSIESLGSLVTVRVNPTSPHGWEEASACAAVRAVARHIAANDPGVILHPIQSRRFTATISSMSTAPRTCGQACWMRRKLRSQSRS